MPLWKGFLMATCPICNKPLACEDSQDSRHQQAVGSAAKDCPAVKGSIWVQVLDDKGASVPGAPVTIPGKAVDTDGSGFAYSDPLDETSYDVELGAKLPDSHKTTHLLPELLKVKAQVRAGEITLVKFRLERINLVTPKIEEEYKVVLLDRGLAAHQAGEPEHEKFHPEPTRIEVSLTETNREQYPFATTAKLKCTPANVDVFLDDKCTTPLVDDLKADQITGGNKLQLWLRGKTAGKFDVSLEFADTADRHIVPAKDPPPLAMGVIELVLLVHQHDVAAVKLLQVDPDEEPLSTYHTNLKDKVLPAQKAMTDEQKVKTGRVLHEQKDGHHGRAKVLIQLLTKDYPAGSDDYEIYVNRSQKSGALELFDLEVDGASQGVPTGPYKLSQLKAADQELWVEGTSAGTAVRSVVLDLSLDRAEGGLDKDVKRHADAARFTVVKLKEVKLDYTAPVGEADAWEPAEKRFFINLKRDPDGRKIKIAAQLSAALPDVVIHFMLVEHQDNRKAANWGVDLPDGTRALTPCYAEDDGGTPVTFGTTEPKWTWKDLSADVKHLDKDDRKNLLHYSEKTDAQGCASKEVTLSRFGGDKFYLAAYIEQDPHLAKYVDGHTDLGKRKPVMTADPIQVWRKFWYREVKVAGLMVSGFRDAAETYKDVMAVMSAGTVVEVPRNVADGFSPRVIYKKHMVSYYVANGAYVNNYPGDNGDALVVGDTNESSFFSRAGAEADKPVMYAMLNAHALWIPGGTDGEPLSVGPYTHPWATPAEFQNSQVSITTQNELLDPPLQGGNLLVQGRWAAQDWIPHPDPTTPSGPERPAGAPPGRWGNGRNGDLAAADVSLDPNRSDPRAFRVTLPAAITVTPGTNTRIRVFGLHVQCAKSFLGTSYRDGIVNAYTPNDLDDFVNTINHETGHAFLQVSKNRPGNAPAHVLQYNNSGSHCAYDSKKCVMYESGPQPGSLNRYCPVCHPFVLASDMSVVRGQLT